MCLDFTVGEVIHYILFGELFIDQKAFETAYRRSVNGPAKTPYGIKIISTEDGDLPTLEAFAAYGEVYEEVKLHEPGRYHLGGSWHLYEMLFFIAAYLHGMEDAEQNMMERVLIDLNIGGLIMFERYLGKGNVIGATATESSDNGLLLMYSSVDGKHFLKSYDKFRTISEEWTVPLDSLTASANLFRLKDGRLMMLVREISKLENIAKIGGADFYITFSKDDGHTFEKLQRINNEEKCYYIMNNRIIRTHIGRILIPVCYVPDECVNATYFEKSGYSGCFYSDDEGKTWNVSGWVEGKTVDQLAEPMVVQGAEEVIHMYMRTGYGYLYHSESCDNAITWKEEQKSMLRSPCAPFCVSYDKYSKKFFAVWDNSFPAPEHQYPRSPICLAVSEDCVNWRMCLELDNNPMHSYGYPMLYFDEEEILVFYYENDSRKFNPRDHKLKMKSFSRMELNI